MGDNNESKGIEVLRPKDRLIKWLDFSLSDRISPFVIFSKNDSDTLYLRRRTDYSGIHLIDSRGLSNHEIAWRMHLHSFSGSGWGFISTPDNYVEIMARRLGYTVFTPNERPFSTEYTSIDDIFPLITTPKYSTWGRVKAEYLPRSVPNDFVQFGKFIREMIFFGEAVRGFEIDSLGDENESVVWGRIFNMRHFNDTLTAPSGPTRIIGCMTEPADDDNGQNSLSERGSRAGTESSELQVEVIVPGIVLAPSGSGKTTSDIIIDGDELVKWPEVHRFWEVWDKGQMERLMVEHAERLIAEVNNVESTIGYNGDQTVLDTLLRSNIAVELWKIGRAHV